MSHLIKEKFIISDLLPEKEKLEAINYVFNWIWEWKEVRDMEMSGMDSFISDIRDEIGLLQINIIELDNEIKLLQSTNKKLLWALTHRNE